MGQISVCKIIRIFNCCEVQIENYVMRVTVRHPKACRVMSFVMPKVIPSGGIFNLLQTTIIVIFLAYSFFDDCI